MAALSSSATQQDTADSLGLSTQVMTNRQALLLLNMVFAAGGVTTATTTSKAKLVNTVTFMVDGVWRTAVTATDNFWVLSGTTVPVGSCCIFLLCLTSAGAAAVVQSSISATLATCNFKTTGGSTTFPFDSLAVVATLSITAGSTSSGFVPGTTLLGATGITATFADGPGLNLLPLLADANGGLQVTRAFAGPNALL
jgi:hypothetical protein